MPAKRSKLKTATRGSVNNIIMESLATGEKYGYEIIKEVEEKTNGKIKLKQPSLYSSLNRFEAKGLIDSYWQESEIGGKRHYYKLTDAGMKYYKKNVLKEEDDFEDEDTIIQEEKLDKVSADDEYLEDKLNGYEIDTHEESQNLSKYEFNVDEKINSLLLDDDDNQSLIDEMYKEINEPVLSQEELEQDILEESKKEEIVADHEFRSPTPITNIIEEKPITVHNSEENAFDDIMKEDDNINNDIFDDIDLSKDYTPTTKEPAPENSKKPIIITDADGITKMYYPDEVEPKKNNKVFDNVVYRTNTIDKVYSAKATTPRYNDKELSSEEKEQRMSSFMDKFDNRSEQIIKEKQASRTNEPKNEEPQFNTNYKSMLNTLYSSASNDDDFVSEEVSYTENMKNYSKSEGMVDDSTNMDSYATSLNDDGYTMKVYSEEKSKSVTNKYLQVNKSKFTFGLVMLAFMLIQITAMLILFKNNNMLFDNQYWVFQLGYIIVAIVAIVYCIPVFLSPNKQSANSFKLSYSLMFGILAFFITLILTYAINTFMGMDIVTIKYYLATLIVPSVLSLNFIMGPIIYWIIIQNKNLYQ